MGISLKPNSSLFSKVTVVEFGATGNGVANDTAAIQKAIGQINKTGGGELVFPPGRYLTGTIKLCDNLTIELLKGAVIVASPELSDYNEDVSVNLNSGLRHYLFEGRGIKNFTLKGDGEIYGNGNAYWQKHPSSTNTMLAKPQRPVIIHMVGCDKIVIEKISIYEASAYTIWLLGCRDVKIDGLTVRNPRFGPNTDVLDIDCCCNVLIINCNLEAGDDCIALKSDSARLGRYASCENIIVNNCILSSKSTGVRLGYEADQPIRNCVFSNLTIHNTRIGLDILSLVPECSYTKIEKGTPVENIIFSNIVMSDVRNAFNVWAGGSLPNKKYVAFVRGLSFCNIRAKTRGSTFIGSVGNSTCVTDILMRDVFIEQVAYEYDGSPDIVEYPTNCWGQGYLPYSMNLRKIDRINLENVQIRLTENQFKDYGFLQWKDIQNGSFNNKPLENSGHFKYDLV